VLVLKVSSVEMTIADAKIVRENKDFRVLLAISVLKVFYF